jgi:hypothetical protein
MNARTNTRTATMVAMTLTLAMVAGSVDAAPRGGVEARAKKEVACRTIASYPMAAWVSPMAVVLTSPQAWSQWNREQVEAGRAVAEEALPAGVDWAKEVVIVLALGEVSEMHYVEAKGARRAPQGATELNLHVETGRGGNCPALVICLDRSAHRNVKLMADYTLNGVPNPGTYDAVGSSLATSGANDGGLVVTTSWGSIKAEYR